MRHRPLLPLLLAAGVLVFAGDSAPPAPFPGCGRVEGLEPEDCPFRSTSCSPE